MFFVYLIIFLWLASCHCLTETTAACCRFKVWFLKVNIVTCCPCSSVAPMACFSLPVSLLPPACSLFACLWPASHLLLLNGCMMGQHPDSTKTSHNALCTALCANWHLTNVSAVAHMCKGDCSCGLFWIMWFGKYSGKFQLLFLQMLVCGWV